MGKDVVDICYGLVFDDGSFVREFDAQSSLVPAKAYDTIEEAIGNIPFEVDYLFGLKIRPYKKNMPYSGDIFSLDRAIASYEAKHHTTWDGYYHDLWNSRWQFLTNNLIGSSYTANEVAGDDITLIATSIDGWGSIFDFSSMIDEEFLEDTVIYVPHSKLSDLVKLLGGLVLSVCLEHSSKYATFLNVVRVKDKYYLFFYRIYADTTLPTKSSPLIYTGDNLVDLHYDVSLCSRSIRTMFSIDDVDGEDHLRVCKLGLDGKVHNYI